MKFPLINFYLFSRISAVLVKASNIPERENKFELRSSNFFAHQQSFL
jgi:hypothetical protein